jgi:lysosomal acid lipase/cholesteryl ester hydrolase
MSVPLIGRLRFLEWPALLVSLVLVLLEYMLSMITALLPSFVIDFFLRLTTAIFTLVPTSSINKLLADPVLDETVRQVSGAHGFVEMCRIFGYDAEEHVVKTEDGYLLGVHRIGGPKHSAWRTRPPTPRPVVYLHHGLLMNSEIWVANVDPTKVLPFVLADLGYDVWLGNNRGNKYSKKHVSLHPTSNQFWDFSIDNFALYDIPDTIKYILELVNQPDLVYIGFSQGSAQAFATLSINPGLNKRVKLFIALAPAMAPPGLRNNIVDSLMRASPSLIYLFFGRKAILQSTAFWQSIMYPPLFVKTIDLSLKSLFNWKCNNITYPQKLVAYSHLYSFTSVKSVVHWFQIIRSGRFHMFDDELESPFTKTKYFYRVASFPTQNITTPIMLIYGKTDSLVDIDVMLAELPEGTLSVGVPGHEHLDMIWGNDVDTLVFPHVFSALKKFFDVPLSLILAGNNAGNMSMSTLNTIGGFDCGGPLDTSTPKAGAGLPGRSRIESATRRDSTASHEQLTKKLSESFSSSHSGFNFGRSEPVVRVTKANLDQPTL